jgi:small-conductance mechanosensitive channel/CRP-like cAMP-binding protein
VPLLLSGLLYAAYRAALAGRPIAFAGTPDIREVIFGPQDVYLLFAAVATFIVFLVRVVDAFVFDFVISRRKHVQAPLLLREIISIVLYVALFSSVVSWLFHYSVRGLLATTTVVAAVVGLALQETLGNLFSGISLHLERTFDVGDVVRSGEFIGVVERVGWRAARIRTFANHIVVLPNSLISRERIEVFPQNASNANLVSVGVAYAADPSTVIGVLERAVANVNGISTRIPPLARIQAFGDSAVVYEVKYWTESFHLRDIIDAEVRRVMWYALQRHGLEIPFPQRVLHRAVSARAVDESDVVMDRLRAVELLAPLSEEEHRILAERTKHGRYARGELILRSGEEGDSMFVIHRGEVAVDVREEGKSREIARLGAGDVFGEMALLTGEARSADVRALSDVDVFEIHKDALHPVLAKNPELASVLSTRIVERKMHIEKTRSAAASTEESSLVSRIRAWFGLR